MTTKWMFHFTHWVSLRWLCYCCTYLAGLILWTAQAGFIPGRKRLWVIWPLNQQLMGHFLVEGARSGRSRGHCVYFLVQKPISISTQHILPQDMNAFVYRYTAGNTDRGPTKTSILWQHNNKTANNTIFFFTLFHKEWNDRLQIEGENDVPKLWLLFKQNPKTKKELTRSKNKNKQLKKLEKR